jgi:hypothetical protein
LLPPALVKTGHPPMRRDGQLGEGIENAHCHHWAVSFSNESTASSFAEAVVATQAAAIADAAKRFLVLLIAGSSKFNAG